jgi:hypothetical protein
MSETDSNDGSKEENGIKERLDRLANSLSSYLP